MHGKSTSDDTYRHRYKENRRSSLKRLGHVYVDHLCQEYEQSDPTQNHNQERDKDAHSLDALSTAGRLIDHLCSWSIDHEIGKAALGLGWLPVLQVQGVSSKAKAEFDKQRAITRSHEPEERGASIQENGVDFHSYPTEVQRQMLINVLERLNGGLRFSLIGELVKSLEALSIGEVRPLLKPKKRGRAWTRAHCQLQALEYVEFWRSHDRNKSKVPYLKDVWKAFDDKPDPYGDRDAAVGDRLRTVSRYKEQAIKHLGTLRMEQQLATARNAGNNVRRGKLQGKIGGYHRQMCLEIYGLERLKEAGRRFRENKSDK